MFRKVSYNPAEGMVIRVKNFFNKKKEPKKEDFVCKECGFVAKSKLGLVAHSRKHK
jgi:hypothetical protein